MRDLFDYLPLSNREKAPSRAYAEDQPDEDEALDTLIPTDPSVAYDMREVIRRVTNFCV